MTAAEFKKKWARYSGKEASAYQEHFNDLCALLGQPTPVAADPTGSESFCFQKRVVKDAELLAFESIDRVAETPEIERGFADVWKRDCFAWEYKGKKKNLDEAYRQLLRYRESLLNPPLLVVCDFERYIVRTNFTGTVQETHEFTNANIDNPQTLHLLRAVFTNPDFLKPQRTTDEVTEKLAQQIGEVARSLQERESVELIDARSRRERICASRVSSIALSFVSSPKTPACSRRTSSPTFLRRRSMTRRISRKCLKICFRRWPKAAPLVRTRFATSTDISSKRRACLS